MINSELAYYIAFPSSDRLYQGAVNFLEVYRNQPYVDAAPVLAEVLKDYIPETLDALLRMPTSLAGVGPTATKIVNVSMATMDKTGHALVKQALKKRKNAELEELSHHIDSMILHSSDTEKGLPLSAIRIPPSLYEQSMYVIKRIENEPASNFHDEIVDVLMAITETLMYESVKKPVDMIPLGPVVKKVTSLGIDTLSATVMKVVKNVFVKMSDEEFLATSRYFDSLLVASTKGI